MPYPASVIAYAFVKKGIEERMPVTQMKVQKMVYFAHGYHLVKYGEPLIIERFEAWKFGPVVPSIYRNFKYFGSRPITDAEFTFYAPSFLNDYELDDKARDAVDYTWNATKNVSAEDLSAWTHQQKSPWHEVYNPSEWGTPISNDAIKHYFEILLLKDVNEQAAEA